MKIISPRIFVIYALAASAGVALLHTSQNVQRAEEKTAALRAEILREQERIQMLKAEWAHLNRPDRLENMAKEFLDMSPPSPQRIISDHPPSQKDETPVQEARPVSFEKPVPPKTPPKKQEQKKTSAERSKTFDELLGEIGGEQ